MSDPKILRARKSFRASYDVLQDARASWYRSNHRRLGKLVATTNIAALYAAAERLIEEGHYAASLRPTGVVLALLKNYWHVMPNRPPYETYMAPFLNAKGNLRKPSEKAAA